MPNSQDTSPSLRIDIAANAEMLCVLRSALSSWCLRAGISTSRTDAACMAVDEAAANIIRHAYQEQSGRIRLTCKVADASIWLELEDDGLQVPLDTIQPRPLDDVRPGGLGVHLIQQVMKSVEWAHRSEGGTRLRMSMPIEKFGGCEQTEEAMHAL